MKDDVITLNGNVKCYVLDELNYKEKRYIFCVQIDENDEMIENSTSVFEVLIKDDKLITKAVEDFEVASVVNNLFMARMCHLFMIILY